MADRPICAVCNRPVEKMTAWDSPATRVRTYAVECHGAVEQTELSERQLYEARLNGGIQFGRAFVPPAALGAT